MSRIHRQGVSLLEMMVVIITGSAILGASTSIIVASLRISRDAGEQLMRLRALTEFERQFRQDAHQSMVATVDGDALVLQHVDGAIRFVQVGTSIERHQPDGDRVHEIYRIKAPSAIRWSVPDDIPTFVRIVFEVDSEDLKVDASQRGFSIKAELGKDSRLAKALQYKESSL